MTPEQREQMIRHAGWKLHELRCSCDMDSPPMAGDIEQTLIVVSVVEHKFRNDERHDIIGNLREYAIRVGVASSEGRRALEDFATKLEEATAS